MGERIGRLNEFARQGNIVSFYGLIRQDVKLLEDIDELPFVDTPLHVAASSGGPQDNQKFAMEMMRLKPSFARKPNLDGDSPIYLALKNGHTQMVRRLLQVDGDLVRVKGKEGRTPLHYIAATAATEQDLALMDKFLLVCPNSIEDVTIQNQTALHIALLENNNLDAFKRLVRWLRKNESENAREILNRQDGEGNTVLHVAVYQNQTEAVWVLLNCVVNLNVKNFDGRTAQDILGVRTQENSEIMDLLSYDGALTCFCLPKVISCCESSWRELRVVLYEKTQMFRKTVLFFERLVIFREKFVEGSRISNEDCNVLLVVAALIMTITYQIVLSPPGGLWQETKSLGQEAPAPAPASASGDVYFQLAGTAIAEGTSLHFPIIATMNYFTFTLSAILTSLLLPSGYIGALFKMALVQLWVSYYYSWGVIIIETRWVWRRYLYGTGICFLLVLSAFFCRHFIGVRVKSLNLHWIFYIVYAYVMIRSVTWLHSF